MSNLEEKESISSTFEVDIIKYASIRRNEIDLLHNESFLGKEVKHKSLFQLLPRHMRRRTMGYIRKRLPHRIRKAAIIKPPSKVNKRPSRKYRRRPSNLLKEYERRKRAHDGKMWLETHIWHAKRFHMSESTYGYRLPLFDNVKCKRAVYKCLNKYACIHDESYHVCHELSGRLEDLLEGLSKLCSPQTGLTFAAKICLNGQYEGRTVLYESNKYPYNCIGPVRFLWKAEIEQSSSKTIWIWSHPSIHKQVESELINVFNMSLKIDENKDVEMESTNGDQQPQVKKRKLENENETINEPIKSQIYISQDEKNTSLKCLKDSLIRFKLLGPLSTTILSNVLKPVESTEEFYEAQGNIWNQMSKLQDANDVVQGTVIGLLVKDPRLLLPKKKTFNKIKQQNDQLSVYSKNSNDLELKTKIRTTNLSKSTLWNDKVIDELNKNKKSTHDINKLRSNYLIPGTELKTIEDHSKIPVILIQNAANNNLYSLKNGTLFSGWDVIIPKTWAMAFWVTLVHNGARAIGQDELNYLLFESGNLKFPNEYLDTNAGLRENDEIKNEVYKKYLLKPPSKRINHLKSGFLCPFYFPIRTIFNLNQGKIEANLNESSIFILRNKQLIGKIINAVFNNKGKKLPLNLNQDEQNLVNNSFIGVRLTTIGKGKIDKYSLLYKYEQLSDSNQVRNELNNSKLVLNKMVEDYKKEFLAKIDGNDKNKSDINKLVKHKFNKCDMLVNEDKYLSYEIELNDSKDHKTPIGFVCNSGITLVNGKFSANGFIITKYIVDLINNKNEKTNSLSLVNYKSPSACGIFKTSKINQFYF